MIAWMTADEAARVIEMGEEGRARKRTMERAR